MTPHKTDGAFSPFLATVASEILKSRKLRILNQRRNARVTCAMIVSETNDAVLDRCEKLRPK